MEPRSYHDLHELSVEQLRRYVRTLPGFPIRGREISRANKRDLLQLIKTTDERARTIAASDKKHEEPLRGDVTPN